MIDAAEAISEQRRDIGRFIYVAHLVELLVAFVLAIPIGWDRERDTRSPGLRTFPLAAVAFQRYEMAIALALVNFLILRFLQTLKRSIP